MADTNPANFANLPKDRVQEIASMGGKASHKNDGYTNKEVAPEGRNPDGTFTKGSEAAKEAGHKGDIHSHDNDHSKESDQANGRREDGTFLPGSEAAKQAGHIGGLHAHGKEGNEKVDEKVENGRRDDGTFLPGSDAAKEAGHKGGVAAAASHKERRR